MFSHKYHSKVKLVANLKQKDSNDLRQNVVLISTGAYCPVHKMHLEVFHVAKEHLERNHQFKVVAGYLSPCEDSYVQSKVFNGFISATHRLELCRIAIESDDRVNSWLDVDSWESSQRKPSPFPRVVNELAHFLKDEPVHIMYICGADLLVRCGIFNLGIHSVVAVGRPGYSTDALKELAESKSVQKLYFIDKDTDDISSTKIRTNMIKGLPIEEMTYPGVVEYLKENKLYAN